MPKPKIAIFDLTDCEGCELEFLSLRENLLELTNGLTIVNWRLVQENQEFGPFDLTFVEGSPFSDKEIELLKAIREQSKIMVALGDCAATGGIPGLVDQSNRSRLFRYSYPKEKINHHFARPLADYVKIDFTLYGCPVTPNEIERYLAGILAGRKVAPKTIPVCYDCKIKSNSCLLLEQKICLGPVTAGGCGAICPSAGFGCYGCFSWIKEANFQALKKTLKRFSSDEEIDRILKIFHRDMV